MASKIAACMLALAVAAGSATGHARHADTYAGMLERWETPQDVNAWIGGNFTYDHSRAVALSETNRARGAPFRIHEPGELFETKTGICVDLSRFAVETLKTIAPELEPQYLRITFDPVRVGGEVLRMHWVASFRRDGQLYFFADSKRPGTISGPYADIAAFILDYQAYRNRQILAFRLVDSYRKEQRRQRARKDARPAPTR